jgi:predicted RNA-binding Zn-ribbon protein involved in translation (DUF1610 family)
MIHVVVQCCSCAQFQVQSRKKVNTWSCPLCGTRQSIRKVYLESESAAECRQLVMQLSQAYGEQRDQAVGLPTSSEPASSDIELAASRASVPTKQPSKWDKYLSPQ